MKETFGLMDFIRAKAELPKIKEPRYGSQLKHRANLHDMLRERANSHEK